jgi:acyl-coenzyme A thioesterase PaaI-like protein
MSKVPALLDATQVTRLVDAHFPQIREGNGRVSIERIDAQEAVVRMAFDERLIRPGGTVSGPAMFKLADFGVYVAILARLGEAGLQAVTTSMTMNFLSRPSPADLVARIKGL